MPKTPTWEDHVVGLSREPVRELVAMANPKNFRRHPVEQRKLFSGVATTVGIVAPVLVNDRTNHMLDGHMRASEAQIAGVEALPVIHIDVSEEDEDIILASYDAVSAMAFEDAAMKAELLKGLTSEDPDLQDYFRRELARQMAEAESGDDLSELGERYGQHDPTAFWPVIRIRCPIDVRARFMAYFKGIVADDDVARVVILLDRLDAPQIDPADYEDIDDESPETPILKILISFWYFRKIDIAKWLKQFTHPVQLFVDSGAYSAQSHAMTIDVGEYAEWLHKWNHRFDHYVSLDVIGDVSEGLRNLAFLERTGLKPIPVFHGGEEMSVLDDYISHGYQYIGLGNIAGRVAGRANNTGAWLVECFQRGAGKSVFHGFGMTTPEHLWTLPWYSVDSSSWSAGFRFGAVSIYVRKEKRVVYLRHVRREPQHRVKWEEYRSDVQRHGQNILDFMHYEIRENPRYAIMGAAAFTLMGQHIRRTRPLVDFPDGSCLPGPHLYLGVMGLPKNAERNTKGRAWYELDAIKHLDDNLEMFS